MQTQEVKSAKICPGRGTMSQWGYAGRTGDTGQRHEESMHRRRLSVANVTAERRRALVSQQRHVAAGPLSGRYDHVTR